jgi:hypothetical protein
MNMRVGREVLGRSYTMPTVGIFVGGTLVVLGAWQAVRAGRSSR